MVAVVRLNEPEYDGRSFADADIQLHDLEFEDCTAPIVAAFFAAAEGTHKRGSAVAVHCKAGLGRTGTLIALYLIRACGFSAREAMGWLRIMRPGSVIGDQQLYLCHAERVAAVAAAAPAVTADDIMLPSTAVAPIATPSVPAAAEATSPPRLPVVGRAVPVGPDRVGHSPRPPPTGGANVVSGRPEAMTAAAEPSPTPARCGVAMAGPAGRVAAAVAASRAAADTGNEEPHLTRPASAAKMTRSRAASPGRACAAYSATRARQEPSVPPHPAAAAAAAACRLAGTSENGGLHAGTDTAAAASVLAAQVAAGMRARDAARARCGAAPVRVLR